MRAMHCRMILPLLLAILPACREAELAQTATPDAATPPSAATAPKPDAPAPALAAEGSPEPRAEGFEAKIGELARQLAKVVDAPTAKAAKPGLEALTADFHALRQAASGSATPVAAPPNVLRAIDDLARHSTAGPVLGETLRQLRAVLE